MDDRSYHGLHMQTPVGGWEEELRSAAAAGKPYRIVKLFWVEGGKTVKSISSNTITVYRKHIQHQQPYLDQAIISILEANKAADKFILQFKDSINQHGHIDYVESINETYPTGNLLAQQKAAAFDRAFIRRLKIHCPYVKPVVYTAPPGNIDHHEYAVLVDLARECQVAGGAFGYHNYWSVVKKLSYVNSPSHARDYHMRWSGLDAYLVSKGIRVNHILGESGPIGAGPTGYWQKPDDGWLKNDVWDGDMDGYLNDLAAMDQLYLKSLAGREGRLLGATLFTTGEPHVGWDHFQIRLPFLAFLTDYIIDSGNFTPPPPIDPPSDDTFEQKAWQVTVEMQRTGQDGIRLNADAGIQQQINDDNASGDYDLQIVTSEIIVDGKTVQAAESRTGKTPRRVYVWEAGVPIYWYEEG